MKIKNFWAQNLAHNQNFFIFSQRSFELITKNILSFIDEQKILTVFSWNSILTKDRQCSQCLLMVSCRLYYAFPKLFAVAAKDVVMQRADDALYCHYIIQTSNFKKILLCYWSINQLSSVITLWRQVDEWLEWARVD